MKQLASSYRAMECFKHYDMLLDIQSLFKEPGGLSGLAQVTKAFYTVFSCDLVCYFIISNKLLFMSMHEI